MNEFSWLKVHLIFMLLIYLILILSSFANTNFFYLKNFNKFNMFFYKSMF